MDADVLGKPGKAEICELSIFLLLRVSDFGVLG